MVLTRKRKLSSVEDCSSDSGCSRTAAPDQSKRRRTVTRKGFYNNLHNTIHASPTSSSIRTTQAQNSNVLAVRRGETSKVSNRATYISRIVNRATTKISSSPTTVTAAATFATSKKRGKENTQPASPTSSKTFTIRCSSRLRRSQRLNSDMSDLTSLASSSFPSSSSSSLTSSASSISITSASDTSLLQFKEKKKSSLVKLCKIAKLNSSGDKNALATRLAKNQLKQQQEQLQENQKKLEAPVRTLRRTTKKISRRLHAQVSKKKSPKSKTSHTPPASSHHHQNVAASSTHQTMSTTGSVVMISDFSLEALSLQSREIPFSRLKKQEKIATGGFKDIYTGFLTVKNKQKRKVAIADLRGTPNESDIKELKLLAELQHENIVSFLGISIPPREQGIPCLIVMDLCSEGDLFDYIRNVKCPPLKKVLQIMSGITSGIQYLHDCNIIHRDVKSPNVLISSKCIPKLTDFGLAKVKSTSRARAQSVVGTVAWQAPELWNSSPQYCNSVDVYSASMVFWEIMQWQKPREEIKYPWQGENDHWIFEHVGQERKRPDISDLIDHWPAGLIEIVEKMWLHDPGSRLQVAEIQLAISHLLPQA